MKKVLILAGHAGVGKSSLGQMIATHTGFTLLDKDTLTLPFVETLMRELTGNPDGRDSQEYVDSVRPLEYKTLLNVLWEQLETQAAGVVLVAPFVQELQSAEWRQEVQHRSESFGYEVEIAWVHSDPAFNTTG